MTSTYPTKLTLAAKSGDRCAFSDCRAFLTSSGSTGPVLIGEAAHIYGEKDGAARYKAELSIPMRNHYDNLIYLCPTCHTKIDKQEVDYPADSLLKIKHEHEKWIAQQIDNGMSEVTFAELEIASRAIASGKHYANDGFHVISPEEKIKKNNLTDAVRALISSGLSRSAEVVNYLSKQAQLDAEFPERLKDGFKNKYLELKQNMEGDSLFYAMIEFTKNGKADFTQQAASLAILCHLFELCEVFEK